MKNQIFTQCLNQQLGLYLAVNTKSLLEQTRKYRITAAIIITHSQGVELQFYDYSREKIIAKKDALSNIVHEAERYRKEFQALFSKIKEEQFKKNLDSLTLLLGEERAKQLFNNKVYSWDFTKKVYQDSSNLTTLEERKQLHEKGIEIVQLEYV